MNEETRMTEAYTRKVSPLEEMFLHAPYAIVTVVARIKGKVTEDMLGKAVAKVQARHTNLRLRIEFDRDGIPWFTAKDVEEIPVEIYPRENDDHWIQVLKEQSRYPFDFDTRPAIRLLLIQSPTRSELVILCHHLICDGLSLAYVARDLMENLGDPSLEVETLPDPDPIDRGNLPEGVSLNSVVKYFVERINKQWREERVTFGQEDYQALTEAYWVNFKPQMDLIELSEQETSRLVGKCKTEGVTVNSALAVALAAAQVEVQGAQPFHSQITVAGNLRDRLGKPAGEKMGFFAGAVSLKFKSQEKTGFWENVRKFNHKIQPLFTNKNLFEDPLVWCYLEPGILQSLSYKMVGGMVSRKSPSFEKLSSFSSRLDVISSMLKRQKMDSFDNLLMGTALTNLGRMDFASSYGELELERLILKPGGAYPLVFVNLLAGVVTCSGKLSLVLEYDEDRIDRDTMKEINSRVLQYLLESPK